jgi:hypothetical protein
MGVWSLRARPFGSDQFVPMYVPESNVRGVNVETNSHSCMEPFSLFLKKKVVFGNFESEISQNWRRAPNMSSLLINDDVQ